MCIKIVMLRWDCAKQMVQINCNGFLMVSMVF